MKKLSSIFAVIAFIVAIGVSYADVLVQSTGYWYDTEEEVVEGPATIDGSFDCGVTGSTICTILGEPAFDEASNAEMNAGSPDPDADGLLKRN